MNLEQIDPFDELSNPLDAVEDLMAAHEWQFARPNEDELTLQITGRHGAIYDMHFIWQEDYGAMQFSCRPDIVIPDDNLSVAAQSLTAINGELWLGHFDLSGEGGMPRFRHTCLFRGMTGTSGAEHIEDMVDIALNECERFLPVFNLLARKGKASPDLLTLAMMETAGES